MKRILLSAAILSAFCLVTALGAASETQELKTTAAVVTTTQLTFANENQNYRHPGVAEDSKGNRLVIFRGPEGTMYYYSYCPKNGSWTAPAPINGSSQPTLSSSLYANVEVDSSDRFHCEWENAKAAVYASFKDGVWTTPVKMPYRGYYDLTSGMTVDSMDRVVSAQCNVTGFDKEVYLTRKGKNDADFSAPFNISRDGNVASTQPHVTVDSLDNPLVVWKSDYLHSGLEENLVIYLSKFDANTLGDIGPWYMLSPDPGWSFLPQVAVNNEDMVMTQFSCSTWGDTLTRLVDPATEKMGEIIPLGIGLCRVPWHTFFSRLVAHGKDFYSAAMNPGRQLVLSKYNWTAAKWDTVHVIDTPVEQFALYSGYDQMLIAWNSWVEPSNVYLTTVGVDPYSKIKIKSASNLTVEKTVERGFFSSYTLNALAWTANPDNTEKGLTITAHRIYRKNRSADDTAWARIAEVGGAVYTYDDKPVPADSDYVYSVTCVDDNEHESKVF